MSELPPHQQRVLVEFDEVTQQQAAIVERLDKLRAFFGTPIYAALPAAEQSRLQSQSVHMALAVCALDGYAMTLSQRIEAFPRADVKVVS